MKLQNVDFVSIENFIESCNILLQGYPESTLILTGGEPFKHPAFFRILCLCTKKFRRVIINSNGTFDNDNLNNLKPFLANNTFLQISIDGPQKIHDRYRGKGVYQSCIDNLLLLSEYSSHVSVSTTVQKETIDAIKVLAKDLNKVPFHHWKVSPEQVVERDFGRVITSNEWNTFVDDILPLCRYRVHIKKMFCFNLWDKYYELMCDENCGHIIRNNCGIGRDKLYVTPEGDVLLCTCFQHPVGNLFVDYIDSIKARVAAGGMIEPDEQSACHTCSYKSICNGGCPGYSKKYFGAVNMGDPRCPIIQKKYEEY